MTTLRQDYFDSSSGIQQTLANANTAGVTFITTNYSVLSSALQTNASQGNTVFTVNIATTYNPTALRLEGLLLEAYIAGLVQGLAAQNIYSFECTPILNTSDTSITSIDFNFSFNTL